MAVHRVHSAHFLLDKAVHGVISQNPNPQGEVQAVHFLSDDPVQGLDLKVPSGQASQLNRSVSGMQAEAWVVAAGAHSPGAHGVQACEPLVSLYVDAGHIRHGPLSGPV